MGNIGREIGGIFKRFKSGKNRMTREVAKAIVDETQKNFEDEGFHGVSFNAWKERKRPEPQKILTGRRPHRRMKKSLVIKKSNFPNIEIHVDKPYADIHNLGTKRIPKRKFLSVGYGVDSPRLDKKIDGIIDKHARRHLRGM